MLRGVQWPLRRDCARREKLFRVWRASSLLLKKEAPMGHIIVANRRGHQVVEWETTDTEEARAQIAEAERIIREAREHGAMVSKKVDGKHVLDRAPFDPNVEEYQIVAPIAGG
jgi:hypothetical protein